MRMAVFDAINSSSDAGYGLGLALGISCLHGVMSRDADPMSLGRESAHNDAGAPPIGIPERLQHFRAVAAPQFRNVLCAADLEHAFGAERPVVRSLTVIIEVQLA